MLPFLIKVAFMLNRESVTVHGLDRPPQVGILLHDQRYKQTGGQAAADEAVLIFVLFIQFCYVDLRDYLTGFLKFLYTVNWGLSVKCSRRLTDPSF